MMQLRMRYLMLVALIIAFAGCDKLIYDQPEDGDKVEQTVFLSVNIRSAEPNSGLRSINYDPTLYEDRVHDLAMVIFKSGTSSEGGERVGVYTTTSLGSSSVATWAFTAEMIPGKYDFYFVGNMGLTEDWIKANITNKDALDTYLENSANELSGMTGTTGALYHGASATEGFPMARVYLNQEITEGGTRYQPKPFKPKQYTGEKNTVVVNSAGEGTDERDYVELIRVVAKLEVIFDATSALNVAEVYFRNANKHFRLVEFDEASTTEREYFNDKETNTLLKDISPSTAPKTSYIYYMPETFIPVTSTLSWSDEVSDDNKPINYFTVVSTGGTQYDVPIISNETSITAHYLAKAKGTYTGYTPNYNIYRNHIYKFNVNIHQATQTIEIIYQVDDWKQVTKSLYMGYGYNVEVDENGKITITNTVDDCMPHKVRLVALNGAYFGTPDITSVEYGYSSDTDTGYAEAKTKAGYFEQFDDLNSDAVTSGAAYLIVSYNGVEVKTFTK